MQWSGGKPRRAPARRVKSLSVVYASVPPFFELNLLTRASESSPSPKASEFPQSEGTISHRSHEANCLVFQWEMGKVCALDKCRFRSLAAERQSLRQHFLSYCHELAMRVGKEENWPEKLQPKKQRAAIFRSLLPGLYPPRVLCQLRTSFLERSQGLASCNRGDRGACGINPNHTVFIRAEAADAGLVESDRNARGLVRNGRRTASYAGCGEGITAFVACR